MNTKHPAKKPVSSQDWHNADIKCALEKKGLSLSRLSRLNGYYRTACALALFKPYPKMERTIADAIGVSPQTIWPSRYDENGNSNRRRGHHKSNATTVRQSGVIQQSEGN